MVHDEVVRAMERHRRWVDRALPGRVVALHPFGSTAREAYRPGRSDVDLLVTVDRRLEPFELGQLRAGQLLAAVPVAVSGLVPRRWTFPGTVNAVYVVEPDLLLPVETIEPVASHSGRRFTSGAGAEVNPVVWTDLAATCVGVVRPPPSQLVSWCRRTLLTDWRGWATATRSRRRLARGDAARAVLGVTRLWVTATIGRVVAEEEAGERALRDFADGWHPLVHDALAWRHLAPAVVPPAPDRVADWVDHVVDVTLS